MQIRSTRGNININNLLKKFVDYLDKKRNITAEYHSALLVKVHEIILKNRSKMVSKGVFLQHNTTAYKSQIVINKLWDLGVQIDGALLFA